MNVRCPDCGAVASYGNEIGHKSDCPSLRRYREIQRLTPSQLLERCRHQNERMLRMEIRGDHVEDLQAFVMSEIARAAEESFDDKVPLVLWFATPKDRQEFLDAVFVAKPGMISKAWP